MNSGVALWATDGQQFAHLHPINVAVDVYSKLADLPNVVAHKLMPTLELPTVFDLCEKMHKKVLIGGVHLGLMPFLAKHYGMQWSAKVYWHVKPGYNALFQLMAPTRACIPLRTQRAAMKAGYRAIGIEPRADSDESFEVGAAAYARGVRAKGMPYKATYVE